MQLGTLLSRFEDAAVVTEILLAMDDSPLFERMRAAAADKGLDVTTWAHEAVGRFVMSANDEQWLGLISGCSRTSDPGLAALRYIFEVRLRAEKVT